jgi:hypothetical protein
MQNVQLMAFAEDDLGWYGRGFLQLRDRYQIGLQSHSFTSLEGSCVSNNLWAGHSLQYPCRIR